jgi:hypothetical protein
MASWTILIARSRSSGGYLFWDVLDAMTPSSFPSDGASTIPRAIHFWATVKGGLRGVYHGVSTEHLQSYLDEYAFRYNNREAIGRGMFDAFLGRIEKVQDLS